MKPTTEGVAEAPRKYRSVSQFNQYQKCPHSYFLARIEKMWKRPAAWLPQGTAFHAVAQTYEERWHDGDPMPLEEAQELFREEYTKDINAMAEITPNFEYWFRSGPYNGEADIERRYHIGLEQVEKFDRFVTGNDDRYPEGQVVWIAPDGTPGIELEFDIELGGVPVTGFIDVIVVDPETGELRVRDYKTGNKPGDDFQLGVYSVAIAETYGVDPPKLGDYYMAGKKGKKAVLTAPFRIGDWTKDRVTEKFQELDDNINAGRFEPRPDPDTCQFCDVSYTCSYRA